MCNFDAIFSRNVIVLVLGGIELVFSTVWDGGGGLIADLATLELYFQSTF